MKRTLKKGDFVQYCGRGRKGLVEMTGVSAVLVRWEDYPCTLDAIKDYHIDLLRKCKGPLKSTDMLEGTTAGEDIKKAVDKYSFAFIGDPPSGLDNLISKIKTIAYNAGYEKGREDEFNRNNPEVG